MICYMCAYKYHKLSSKSFVDVSHYVNAAVMDPGDKAVLPHNSALRLDTIVPYSSSYYSGHKNPADAMLGQN